MKRTNVLNQLNRLTLDNCSASFPSLTFPTIFYIEDIYIECGPSPFLILNCNLPSYLDPSQEFLQDKSWGTQLAPPEQTHSFSSDSL